MPYTLKFPQQEQDKFNRAVRAIASTVPARLQALVLYAEAATILKECFRRTKQSTVAKVTRRERASLVRNLKLEEVNISAGRGNKYPPGTIWLRGRNKKGERFIQEAGRVTDTGSIRWKNRHFKDLDWAALEEAAARYAAHIASALRKAVNSIGFARQGWVQIGDNLGIDLSASVGGQGVSALALRRAKAARSPRGTAFINGVGQKVQAAAVTVLRLVLTYPKARQMGFDQMARSVIAGRAKYFDQNVRRGVFDSLEEVRRAYPYLRLIDASA